MPGRAPDGRLVPLRSLPPRWRCPIIMEETMSATRLPFITFALLFFAGQALAQGWTCYTEAGGPCMSPLGPVGPQAHIAVSPPGHGRTQTEASADALRLCNPIGLCCRVTHCTPGDPCGACTKK